MVVLDTSALVFWTLDPERLSKTAEQAIKKADRVCLSSISIWEIGVKSKKDKLDLPLSIRDYAENLGRIDRVEVLPVDVRTWIGNLELDWDHRDPADRTIVATAKFARLSARDFGRSHSWILFACDLVVWCAGECTESVTKFMVVRLIPGLR